MCLVNCKWLESFDLLFPTNEVITYWTEQKQAFFVLKLETPDTSLPGCIDFRPAYFLKSMTAVAYLFAWLEVGLPFSDVLGILLVQLFEFQCLVFHQELAFLVLHLTMIQVWSLKHFSTVLSLQ